MGSIWEREADFLNRLPAEDRERWVDDLVHRGTACVHVDADGAITYVPFEDFRALVKTS